MCKELGFLYVYLNQILLHWEEPQVPNTLTSTAKQDLKGLLKETHKRRILKVDHGDKVDCMTDGEALGLLISVVKRTI